MSSTSARIAGNAVNFIHSGFCKGAEARNVYGQPVHPIDDSARSWSIVGALKLAEHVHNAPFNWTELGSESHLQSKSDHPSTFKADAVRVLITLAGPDRP